MMQKINPKSWNCPVWSKMQSFVCISDYRYRTFKIPAWVGAVREAAAEWQVSFLEGTQHTAAPPTCCLNLLFERGSQSEESRFNAFPNKDDIWPTSPVPLMTSFDTLAYTSIKTCLITTRTISRWLHRQNTLTDLWCKPSHSVLWQKPLSLDKSVKGHS